MNSIVILTLVFFLTGNASGSKAIQAPSMEDCQAAVPLLQKQLLGTSIPGQNGEKLFVLDVQGTCQQFTKDDNA